MCPSGEFSIHGRMIVLRVVVFSTLAALLHGAPLSAVLGPPGDSDQPSRDWPVIVHAYASDHRMHEWGSWPDTDDNGSNRDWPVAVIDVVTGVSES
ncbi:hypothetical protein IWW56_000005 [Coemansia sp. RSA 2131]|nr:hypothetical protein IWW56_000005 [Coemansia sp. RSA 2131]